MIRRNRHRPDNPIIVMALLNNSRQRAPHADTVAAHNNRAFRAVVGCVIHMHRVAVFCVQLENLPHFNAARQLQMPLTMRALLALFQIAQIRHLVNAEIAALIVHIQQVAFAIIRAHNYIKHRRHFAVRVNLHAFHAARPKIANLAAALFNLRIFCQSQLIAAQQRLQFYFVDSAVAAHQHNNQLVVRLIIHGLDNARGRHTQEFRHILNRAAIGSVHLFNRQHFFRRNRQRVAPGDFISRRIIAGVAVQNRTFPGIGERHKFVAALAADSAAVRLHRSEIQPAAAEHAGICVIHQIVAYVQTGFVRVKGVQILHNKLAAAHQTKARAAFITIFHLHLIQKLRQLLVGAHVIAEGHADKLLMRWAKAKIAPVSVLNTPHFRAVNTPAPAFLPNFRRLEHRHHQFLPALRVHFLANNIFDFENRAPCQR